MFRPAWVVEVQAWTPVQDKTLHPSVEAPRPSITLGRPGHTTSLQPCYSYAHTLNKLHLASIHSRGSSMSQSHRGVR